MLEFATVTPVAPLRAHASHSRDYDSSVAPEFNRNFRAVSTPQLCLTDALHDGFESDTTPAVKTSPDWSSMLLYSDSYPFTLHPEEDELPPTPYCIAPNALQIDDGCHYSHDTHHGGTPSAHPLASIKNEPMDEDHTSSPLFSVSLTSYAPALGQWGAPTGDGHSSHLDFPDPGESIRREAGDALSPYLPISLNAVIHFPLSSKPSLPLFVLIQLAIYSSTPKKLTLQEICTALRSRFPYFVTRTAMPRSVRHLLSLMTIFQKIPRLKGQRGKGSYWTLNTLAVSRFGRYKRERKRAKRGKVDDINPAAKRRKSATVKKKAAHVAAKPPRARLKSHLCL
ncbi:hypothetical protein R3P38DRAFT_2908050 [Favolaschia claudopus]|uniref:Fork-head domain-containing protein n=1 Tax=Favolaschia claudopus TaxID=2862362 RepID=A0AAW0CE63_9AGAR